MNFLRQIENDILVECKTDLPKFCREKNELNESLMKLQAAVTQFREKEAEASLKVKRSLDIVDQAQFEKAQVYSIHAAYLS
jgi:hypothetical protein